MAKITVTRTTTITSVHLELAEREAQALVVLLGATGGSMLYPLYHELDNEVPDADDFFYLDTDSYKTPRLMAKRTDDQVQAEAAMASKLLAVMDSPSLGPKNDEPDMADAFDEIRKQEKENLPLRGSIAQQLIDAVEKSVEEEAVDEIMEEEAVYLHGQARRHHGLPYDDGEINRERDIVDDGDEIDNKHDGGC